MKEDVKVLEVKIARISKVLVTATYAEAEMLWQELYLISKDLSVCLVV